jgi:SdpI/YfhL protein family
MNVGILVVAILDMLVGFLFIAICRPLVQGKIGRNGLYGFRTPKTLASDKVWYAVNRGAAKTCVYMSIGMVIFGIVVALLSIVMALVPSARSDYMEDTLLFAALAAPNVIIVGLIVAPNIELKKLDKDSLADPEEIL